MRGWFRAASRAAVVGLAFAPGCGGERFVNELGADGGKAGSGLGGGGQLGGGAGDGGASPTSGGASGDAGEGAAAGAGEGGSPSAQLVFERAIQRDEDDAVFITRDGVVVERLRYDALRTDIEVGTDAEQGRIGLRFELSIPPASRIVLATLALTRVDGSADSGDTMQVHVYDSANVPVFNPQHRHRPEVHASRGVWETAIGGFAVGETSERTISPNIAELVQHVVNRADYLGEGNAIGFVLSPDAMSGYAMFEDWSALTENMASLTVVYETP